MKTFNKILKIPFSAGAMGRTNGCENAPEKIVESLKKFYSNEKGRETKYDFVDVKIDKGNIEETNQNMQKAVGETEGNIIALGGDHSITYSLFKAFSKKNPDSGLIIFDAHPDCINNFNPPTHEDFLKTLVEEGIVKPEKIILIGIRNWHSIEHNFLREKKIKYYSMKEIFQTGIHEVMDGIMETARQWNSFYLSIDIDVCDPAFAPGTGISEPGGLSARDLIYSIQRIRLLENLGMIDIVEVNPEKDVNDMTSLLAAKLVKEFS